MVDMTWRAIRGVFREYVGLSKVVVYTAITGNYDHVSEPATKVPGWKYLCFTDDACITAPGWEVSVLPKSGLDQIRHSRLPKILAHRFLSGYDTSIWIDGNLEIQGDLEEFCKVALMHVDIAFFRHGDFRPSVAAEVDACWQAKKAPLEVMARQYESYCAAGFPDDAGIIPEAGVIARRHHRSDVRVAMEEWWGELLRHSARDQIGLPYVLWKRALPFKLLDHNLRTSPWFRYRHHGERPQPKT